jgi:YD repeat-containing protein
MKNILGKEGNLKLFNEDGILMYYFNIDSDGFFIESTYDSNGNELTFKDSNGFSYERTYDSNGNVLINKNSNGVVQYYNETYGDK